MNQNQTIKRSQLTRYAWLSISAALMTIALKSLAYVVTGSVGLLSDHMTVLTHLEPIEDPSSPHDMALDRAETRPMDMPENIAKVTR